MSVPEENGRDVVVAMRDYLKTRTWMSIDDEGQMTAMPSWLIRKAIKHIEDCSAKKNEAHIR